MDRIKLKKNDANLICFWSIEAKRRGARERGREKWKEEKEWMRVEVLLEDNDIGSVYISNGSLFNCLSHTLLGSKFKLISFNRYFLYCFCGVLVERCGNRGIHMTHERSIKENSYKRKEYYLRP